MSLGGETLSDPLEELEAEEQIEVAVKEMEKLEKLTPEQVSLCQYRHMLLCYLDRLSTYEVCAEIF